MRIGFFPNMGKSTIMAVLKMAAHICREEQIEVYLPDDLERPDTYKVLQIPKENVLPRPEIFKHIDVAFSFGGDGTIIHLARQIFSYNIPVCGINLGELGFLNQIEVHQLQSHIKRIVQGDYTIEKRGHLYAYVDERMGQRMSLYQLLTKSSSHDQNLQKWPVLIWPLMGNTLKCILLMGLLFRPLQVLQGIIYPLVVLL